LPLAQFEIHVGPLVRQPVVPKVQSTYQLGDDPFTGCKQEFFGRHFAIVQVVKTQPPYPIGRRMAFPGKYRPLVSQMNPNSERKNRENGEGNDQPAFTLIHAHGHRFPSIPVLLAFRYRVKNYLIPPPCRVLIRGFEP